MRNRLVGVPATDAHAVDLAPRMRAADREEVAASCGHSPLEALRASLAASTHAVTALDCEGRVVCIFGCAPIDLMSNVGSPWLLGSDLMADHWREIVRRSRKALANIMLDYPELENAVDARHVEAIRWLRWLGFQIGVPVPMNKSGILFLPFEVRFRNV